MYARIVPGALLIAAMLNAIFEVLQMTRLRIFHRFRSLLGDTFYSRAFENLEAEASEWRQGRDGYRAAFEKLEAEASEWRQGWD